MGHAPSTTGIAQRRIRTAGLALMAAVIVGACDDPLSPLPDHNPLAGLELYVPFPSSASEQAEAWRETRPEDAAAIDRIAEAPRGVWLTTGDPVPLLTATLDAAESTGTVPVLVAYYIPERDCTGAGAPDGAAYRAWIDVVAGALRGRPILVLEPDALAAAECAADPDARLELLAYGARTLTAAGARVYIDAGHPRWLPVVEVAARLRQADVAVTEGFALNVANFVGTAENVAYGHDLVRALGGGGFVIDTGRNGAGPAPDGEWCNPPGRKLGPEPTTLPPYRAVHALLWIKRPGESDGVCNGGPPSGEWWPEYALGLAS